MAKISYTYIYIYIVQILDEARLPFQTNIYQQKFVFVYAVIAG